MSLPTDWFLLFLRLLFVVVLYLFLYQIVRLTARELTTLAERDAVQRPARPGKDRLVVVDPADASIDVGTVFPLTPSTLVGRHPGCTVALDDSFVSAEHAELERHRGGWLLRDLGSTNGTFVNGAEVIAPTDVRDGDIVQFGRVKLQMVC
jgi:hypothetical protein